LQAALSVDAALRGGPCCEVPLRCVRPWTDDFSNIFRVIVW
jgi:hypothetical protein